MDRPLTRTDPISELDALATLRTDGYAVIDNILSSDDVHELRGALDAIAGAERENGTAILEDGVAADGNYRPGVNQRVVSLLAKSELLRRVVTCPTVINVVRRLFADAYGIPAGMASTTRLDDLVLSSVTANIANPGGQAMTLHADQGFVPPSTPYPVLANALWPLVDFTTANGATRIAPGSHTHDPRALFDDPPDSTIPIIAAAGSVVLVDGRSWHGTSANTTNVPRPAILINYCRPWVRPFAPHLLEIERSDARQLPADLLNLIGCHPWFVYGHTERAYLDRQTVEA